MFISFLGGPMDVLELCFVTARGVCLKESVTLKSMRNCAQVCNSVELTKLVGSIWTR